MLAALVGRFQRDSYCRSALQIWRRERLGRGNEDEWLHCASRNTTKKRTTTTSQVSLTFRRLIAMLENVPRDSFCRGNAGKGECSCPQKASIWSIILEGGFCLIRCRSLLCLSGAFPERRVIRRRMQSEGESHRSLRHLPPWRAMQAGTTETELAFSEPCFSEAGSARPPSWF